MEHDPNGEIIWFEDVRHQLNRSRQIIAFHSPNALREMLTKQFDQACQWFFDAAKSPFHHQLRPYQKEANQAKKLLLK